MKYVIVEERQFGATLGNYLNPVAYLDLLPAMRDKLPSEAWKFASDPEHYDFYGTRCVKDLKLNSIRIFPSAGRSMELVFNPNDFKHEEMLTITYTQVYSLEAVTASGDQL